MLKLIPGHCDPTANVHDWYVGVRNGKVETLWPVSARGKAGVIDAVVCEPQFDSNQTQTALLQ